MSEAISLLKRIVDVKQPFGGEIHVPDKRCFFPRLDIVSKVPMRLDFRNYANPPSPLPLHSGLIGLISLQISKTKFQLWDKPFKMAPSLQADNVRSCNCPFFRQTLPIGWALYFKGKQIAKASKKWFSGGNGGSSRRNEKLVGN